MRYLMLMLVVISQPTFAAHWVYLYDSPNITYSCANRESYVDDIGGYWVGSSCTEAGTDYEPWPDVYGDKVPVWVSVGNPVKAPIVECRFVSQANSLNGNSWTNLDCRHSQE